MNRVGIGLAVMTIVATPVLLDAQNWPQFRGAMAGVGVDHPDLPDSWSTTENVAWVTSIPGIGWSSPIVWGDHVFLTTVVNSGQQEPPKPGFYLGDWPASTAPHRWMVRRRLRFGQSAMGEGGWRQRAREGQASEE